MDVILVTLQITRYRSRLCTILFIQISYSLGLGVILLNCLFRLLIRLICLWLRFSPKTPCEIRKKGFYYLRNARRPFRYVTPSVPTIMINSIGARRTRVRTFQKYADVHSKRIWIVGNAVLYPCFSIRLYSNCRFYGAAHAFRI